MNNLDFEEILLDSTVQNKNYEQLNTPISLKRTLFFFVLIGVLFLLLFLRVTYLQAIKGKIYYSLSEQNRLRYIPIKAPRGVIYDRYGNVLVNNKVSLSLMFFPQEFKENEKPSQILTEISQIFNLQIDKIKNSIKNTDLSIDPILLKTNISLKEARDFESLNSTPKQGFQLIEDYTREYIHDEAFSHIIGYTGKMNKEEIQNNPEYLISDIIGKAGIEAYYEKYLHGMSGKQFLEIDANINVNSDIGSIKSISGNDIYLTIDKDLQIITYNALIEAIHNLNIKKGGAIAINPKTGEILSMVSIPSYNINILSQGKPADKIEEMFNSQDMPFMNRIISGLYAPGSTIKPLMAMAALNEKSIDPKQTYYFGKQLVVPNIYDPDNPSIFRDWKDQGIVDMETSLAYSCNIYFYAIGGGYEDKNIQGIGSQKIKEYWEKFHLGKSLGIDLYSEQDGVLPDKKWKQENKNEPWYLGDTYNISIGQGDLLVTPLQIAYYIASIANDGEILKPFLAKQITTESNAIAFSQSKKILNNLNFKQEYFNIVNNGMRKVITMGSAGMLQNIGMKVAGKTGTPQIAAGTKTNAFFVSFAPYEDPEILLLIMLEEPPEGSITTIPIADQILRWYEENRFNKN